MIRLIGFAALLFIMVMLLQYFSIEYYDYEKKRIPPAEVTNADSVYAVVDGLGFVVALKTNVGPNIQPFVLIFWATCLFFGLLLLFDPAGFPLNLIRNANLRSFAVVLTAASALFLIQYLRYLNWSSPPGLSNPMLTFLRFLVVTVLVSLGFMLSNKRLGHLIKNEGLIIWFVLASIMVANGLLVETYSWTNPTHHGDMAQHDWLEVAVYSGWTHNWTFGYTLFRGVNNALIILGITIISVISSAPKKM